MKKTMGFLCTVLLLFGFLGTSVADTVNLNTWTAESYPAVSGFGAGVWTVSSDGSTVTQSVNGQPTIFYSDFNAFGTLAQGNIQLTTGWDDDFVGFVLGFQPNDTTNSAADYLLVDWKKATQWFDFGSPSSTPGSTAYEGLAVSRVTGIPTADEFWGHVNFTSNTSGGLEELARATNLGNTGWNYGTTYTFGFDFGPSNLDVYVNGVLELAISGVFSDGRLGFYNFSQENVTYSSFTMDSGSYPVPEPAMMLLLGTGLIGLAGLRRKYIKK